MIGGTTRVTGRVEGAGALRVDGSVAGDVSVTGALSIVGSVQGDVTADELDVSGDLSGDATTQGPIHVRAGATVRGVLSGARVSIEPGATVSVVLDTAFELDGKPAKRR